jgi:N-acetylglucosaminyldiphosphoundecaprenol N-acetyl-beta-D-mannosaminyltransferase
MTVWLEEGVTGERVRHVVLGMHLDYIEPEDFIGRVIAMAASGLKGFCCVSNVYQCVLAHDDPEFRDCINTATFVVPDSVVLQRSRSFLLDVPVKRTLKGAEIMSELCRQAAEMDIPIALIGGKDLETLQILKDALIKLYPNLEIAFAHSPPFGPVSAEEDAAVISRLNGSGAKLAFVGLGCPKQERWMARNSSGGQAVMIGVGAAFDFLAGVVRPSPTWVHQAGLEWLYRLVSEPKRLWRRYLTSSPRFIALLLAEKFRPGRGRSV